MATTNCAKCGALVRLDHPACPACGAVRSVTTIRPAPTPAPAPAAAPRREDVEIEIRSRLMWGEAPSAIRADFLRKGVRPAELDGLLRRLIEERKKHYRSTGVKNVVGGGAVVLLGGLFMLISNSFFKGALHSLPIWILFASITAPIGGLLLIFRGIGQIRRPGVGERETEADDDDD